MPRMLSFHGPDGSRLGQFRLARLESCLAIVGPPERASRAARRIGGTAQGFRIEVFSDRVSRGAGSGQAETDIDRLATPVSSSYIGRVLLATPVGEQERPCRETAGRDSCRRWSHSPRRRFVRHAFWSAGDVCSAPVLKRPLPPFTAPL